MMSLTPIRSNCTIPPPVMSVKWEDSTDTTLNWLSVWDIKNTIKPQLKTAIDTCMNMPSTTGPSGKVTLPACRTDADFLDAQAGYDQWTTVLGYVDDSYNRAIPYPEFFWNLVGAPSATGKASSKGTISVQPSPPSIIESANSKANAIASQVLGSEAHAYLSFYAGSTFTYTSTAAATQIATFETTASTHGAIGRTVDADTDIMGVKIGASTDTTIGMSLSIGGNQERDQTYTNTMR